MENTVTESNIIVSMNLSNERILYFVTSSVIGWTHTHIAHCVLVCFKCRPSVTTCVFRVHTELSVYHRRTAFILTSIRSLSSHLIPMLNVLLMVLLKAFYLNPQRPHSLKSESYDDANSWSSALNKSWRSRVGIILTLSLLHRRCPIFIVWRFSKYIL